MQRLELPEGIKVTLLPKKSRGEEVQLMLTLRYGNEENLKGFEAASGFLPELMLRGTKKLSYQQLRDELDRLEATLSDRGRRWPWRRGGGGVAALGAVSFSIQAKRDTLPAVLDILRQVLREPLLPAGQFEVMKRERLASLEQMRTEPGMLAARLLQRHLAPYPKDDIRYVPTIDESHRASAGRDTRSGRAAVSRVSRLAGRRAGDRRRLRPRGLSADPQETFAGWTAAKPYARIATAAPAGLAGVAAADQHARQGECHLHRRVGIPAARRRSRLPGAGDRQLHLRRRHALVAAGHARAPAGGLSYGVGSSFSASSFDPRARLTINAICNPQNIGKVEKAIAEEFARLLRDGVTADELTQAKQGYLQAQKVARTSDAALAGMLADLSHVGRTMAYTAELENKIAALTPEQVIAAVRKHFDPQALVIVTAGDFEVQTAGGQP